MLVRAASENRVMAAALGVNERLLFTAVFALGAGLAGLAGALQLPREPATLGMDLATIADAFVVTVVGGLGSIPGAFIAALMISLLKSLCIGLGTVDVGGVAIAFPKLTLVAEFVLMAIVLALKPQGLLGRAPAIAATTALAEFRRAVPPVRPHRPCSSAPSLSLRWRCCRSWSTTTRWYSRPTCSCSRCSRRACACCSGPAA